MQEEKAAARVVGFAALALLLGVGAWWLSRAPDRITVATWSGDYANAQAAAIFNPYTDDSGVQVKTAIYVGGIDELTRQVESGRSSWDVIDFELSDAAEACRRGLLETIDPATLPKGDNGAPASADFVPGAIGHCWVGSLVYSQVIAFDPKRFAQGLPVRAADFFDVLKFPGGRGLKDAPKGNLELALIADGVAAKDVYDVLSSPEGVARALAKLDSIRSAIQWWRTDDEALGLLANGRTSMTIALNSGVMEAVQREHRSIGVVWDGQRYELHAFGVPRGTLNKQQALDFIRFATETKQLAHTRLLPFGPARRSAVPTIKVGFIAEPIMTPDSTIIPPPTRAQIEQQHASFAVMDSLTGSPTTHMENALLIDPDWWAVHGPAIEARWKDWRGQ